MSEHPTVAELISEMRTIALVAGQCSVEGPQDSKALMAAAEAKRASRWADALARASSLAPEAPTLLRELIESEIATQDEYARGDTPVAEAFKDRPGPAGHAHTAAVLRAVLRCADMREALAPVAPDLHPLVDSLRAVIQGVILQTRGFNEKRQMAWCRSCSRDRPESYLDRLHDPECAIYKLHAWLDDEFPKLKTAADQVATRDRVAPPSGAQKDDGKGDAPANDLPHQGGQDLRAHGGDGSER